MKFEGSSGIVYDCNLQWLKYNNGNTGIRLVSNDEYKEPIAIATVNFSDELPEDEVYIKDYSENTGMEDFLKKYDIIEYDPIDYRESGFVIINKFKLTKHALELKKDFEQNRNK